jgi:misacylated tRNA(Ala) deacylase
MNVRLCLPHICPSGSMAFLAILARDLRRFFMAVYLCHEQPNLLEHDTQIIDSRPGAVLLSRSALHPGGGGQEADQATLEHAGGRCRILDVTQEGALYWHVLDADLLIETGAAHVSVNAARRSVLAQLHTATHIMNALVYRKLEGALVTGAQINGDGTARMDFDLPEVDNDLLRAIEPEINDVIRQAMPVRAVYVSASEAHKTPGLLRSLSVTPPPTPDGRYRVIEIGDLDRQACGGTHVSNTGESRPVRMVKIENKGRRNRRIRIALV